MQPTPVSLPGKFHGQRSLAGYSLWGHKESDTNQQLSMLFLNHLQCVIKMAPQFLLSSYLYLICCWWCFCVLLPRGFIACLLCCSPFLRNACFALAEPTIPREAGVVMGQILVHSLTYQVNNLVFFFFPLAVMRNSSKDLSRGITQYDLCSGMFYG